MGRVAARPRAAGGGGPQRGRWLHRRAPFRCRRARQVDRATGCDRRRPPGRTGGRRSMNPGIPVLLAMAAMLGACAHAPGKSITDDQARFEGTALAGNVASAEERRVGKECVRTCRYRGSRKHKKKTLKTEQELNET